MYQLVLAILALAGVWEAYQHLLTPAGKEKLKGYLLQWFTVLFEEAQPILSAVEGELQPLVSAFVSAFNTYGPGIKSAVETPVSAFAQENFSLAEANLTTMGESTPDNAVDAAAKALAQAFGFGIASAGVTAAFEATFPKKLNTFNGAGPMLAQLAGFEEISSAIRRPLYENAFGKAAAYHYRSVFRPELPDEQDAVLWHARRLLTDDQLRTVFKYSGLKTEYEEPYVKSAFRAVQPRAIASAIADTPFPRAAMQDLLLFGGYRDADIALLLDVFETNSVKNVRQQYLSAIITAAERGTLTDADLESDLTDLNFSDQAKHFVRLTVAVRKLEMLLELYRKQVTIEYETGQLADADYIPTLEAAGIAAPDAQAHYGVDSARVRGKALAEAERATAAAARKLQAAEVREAEALYMTGQIDEAALVAALEFAGLPASLVAMLVAIYAARKTGSQQLVYGKLLYRPAAQVLREQVAALKEQVVKKLVDVATASAQLDAYGIPHANRDALLAEWFAQAAKTKLPL
jgi:hypothetical protein